MPLTPAEIAFLGPTLAEYTELRNGPAWRTLRERGIGYQDLVWMMEAYKFVDPPRVETVVTAEGTSVEVFKMGRETSLLPVCPWPGPEAVQRRNTVMEVEVEASRKREAK